MLVAPVVQSCVAQACNNTHASLPWWSMKGGIATSAAKLYHITLDLPPLLPDPISMPTVNASSWYNWLLITLYQLLSHLCLLRACLPWLFMIRGASASATEPSLLPPTHPLPAWSSMTPPTCIHHSSGYSLFLSVSQGPQSSTSISRILLFTTALPTHAHRQCHSIMSSSTMASSSCTFQLQVLQMQPMPSLSSEVASGCM